MAAAAISQGNGSTCLLFHLFALSDDRSRHHPGEEHRMSLFLSLCPE